MNNTNIYVYLVYFQHTSVTRKKKRKKESKQRRAIVLRSPNWICQRPDVNSAVKLCVTAVQSSDREDVPGSASAPWVTLRSLPLRPLLIIPTSQTHIIISL